MRASLTLLWKKASLPLLALAWMLTGNSNGSLAMASGVERILQDEAQDEGRVRTDIVRLIPFNVQIALTGPVEDVNLFALTDIVTDWMTDAFETKAGLQEQIPSTTTFQSLGLELRNQRRRDLQQSVEGVVPEDSPYNLFSAAYEGISIWERRGTGTPPTDPEIVELIQRSTFVEDARLLTLLQQAEEFTGLGEAVFDVRAFVTPTGANTGTTGGVSNSNLEIIIIIAIVVACLAFGLLMFAVIWAWRTDQSKRDAYKMNADRSLPRVEVPTGSSESDYNDKSPTGISPPAVALPQVQAIPQQHPPAEISQTPQNDYADSVISEDISTSLTAYYRSGMASYTGGAARAYSSSGTPAVTPREVNDGASVSSMDSYGYSLDGYAPSLGPAPQGYPVGPINAMIKDPETSYADDDDNNTLSTKEGGADQSGVHSAAPSTDHSAAPSSMEYSFAPSTDHSTALSATQPNDWA